MSQEPTPPAPTDPAPRRRRPRYRGTHPRRFEEKYKEHHPQRYPETVAKVLASGKTPAGSHRPIMVDEMLEALQPQPGQTVVDCTLGYGGHAAALLPRIQPDGRLLGLDRDPIELPKTQARLMALGFGPQLFAAYHSNFAGLAQILARAGLAGADLILVDLGVSSMQLDDPERGFSIKLGGPLDMRMNPKHGQAASGLLRSMAAPELAELLAENADEPHASVLAEALAGRTISTTTALAAVIRGALVRQKPDERELSLRRVFQALRVAVNDEFSALEALLRQLPTCLNPKGRVAILTFHSGEDRRVKKAFEAGLQQGVYSRIAPDLIRASPAERHANPRATAAKLRWAERSA